MVRTTEEEEYSWAFKYLVFYNLDSTDHDTINKYLSTLVSKSLMELENSYCLQIGVDNRSINPLTLGRISSYYYLKHNTVRLFSDLMKSECTIPELIDVMSNAAEFAELPVRHNEDQINSDLASQLPLEVNQSALDSAHTKTNILLQAYFCRLPMPSSDYHTDTKSVLDQAIRVLQAMLDVSADQGWLVTSLNVIVLIQMIVQGQWWYDPSLLQLPNVQPYHTYFFRTPEKGSKSKSGPDVRRCIETLPELIATCDGKFDVFSAMLDSEMSPQNIDQAFKVLTKMPEIEVGIQVRGWLKGASQSLSRPVNIRHRGGLRSDADWLPVHADQEYVLSIAFRRLNKTRRTDTKAHSLHFPKPKDEGWIIVVGIVDTKDVVALKRVGYIRGKTTAQIALCTPETTGRVVYTVYVMSDAYLGLDQQYDVCLEVIESCTETQVNTELRSGSEGDD